MEFKNEKVDVFKRYTLCECGGRLIRNVNENGTSTILTSYPPKYPHKCEQCGKIVNIEYISPEIVYETPNNKGITQDGNFSIDITKDKPKDVVFINGEPYDAEIILKALEDYTPDKLHSIKTCYRCKKNYMSNHFICDDKYAESVVYKVIRNMKDLPLCDDCLEGLWDWILCNKSSVSMKIMGFNKRNKNSTIYINE